MIPRNFALNRVKDCPLFTWFAHSELVAHPVLSRTVRFHEAPTPSGKLSVFCHVRPTPLHIRNSTMSGLTALVSTVYRSRSAESLVPNVPKWGWGPGGGG